MNFDLPQISPEHRKAIAHALASYDEVARLNAAIDKQSQKIAFAQSAHESAAKALAENDTELALAITDAESRSIEAEGKKLAAALAEAVADVARQLRVAAALAERLEAAEVTLDGERVDLQKVAQEYGSVVVKTFAEHVAIAAAPMIQAMRMLVVASTAAGTHVTQQLSEMLLPDLRGTGYLLHGPAMRAFIDGESVPLSNIGEDPELAQLASHVREPRAALNKLEAYKPRALRAQEIARAAMFAERGYASQRRD